MLKFPKCFIDTGYVEEFTLIYCPYTDKEIEENETSIEHIIPSSLGGADDLAIRADAFFNKKVGSELDGALSNEFFFALRRTRFDSRGHSGKQPYATVKNARYGEDNRPAQARFSERTGLKIWDAKDRSYNNRVPTFQISLSINIDLPVRFVAKVALSSGYMVYGDLFREHVDHRQFRDTMNIDPSKLDHSKSADELGLGHMAVNVDTYLHKLVAETNPKLACLRSFCSDVKGSVIVLMQGNDCFAVTVGILGLYVGTVIVPADSGVFPDEEDHYRGHVLAVIGKTLKRLSLDDALKQWVGLPSHTATMIDFEPVKQR